MLDLGESKGAVDALAFGGAGRETGPQEFESWVGRSPLRPSHPPFSFPLPSSVTSYASSQALLKVYGQLPNSLSKLQLNMSPSPEELEEVLLNCRYGELDELKTFIDTHGVDAFVEAKDERGTTGLHYVCGNGHLGASLTEEGGRGGGVHLALP